MQAFLNEIAEDLRASGIAAAIEVADRIGTLAADYAPPDGGTPPAHLGATLAARGAHPALRHLGAEAAHFPWTPGSFVMPQGFTGRYAYCTLLGGRSAYPSADFSLGLYLQQPDSWYPMHSHAAEEVYFVLSGTARWSRDGVEAQSEPPGRIFRHAPHERHATRTGAEPLLALWAWLGDQEEASYQIDPE